MDNKLVIGRKSGGEFSTQATTDAATVIARYTYGYDKVGTRSRIIASEPWQSPSISITFYHYNFLHQCREQIYPMN